MAEGSAGFEGFLRAGIPGDRGGHHGEPSDLKSSLNKHYPYEEVISWHFRNTKILQFLATNRRT